MEHFIGIAFWIILFACLQTESNPLSDFGVTLLQENVKCPSDSTFYAPKNVEKQCITTALDCVFKELNGTVREECEDPKGYIDMSVEFLDRQIKKRLRTGHTRNNSSECACERWPDAAFSDFLNEVFSLLTQERADSSQL